MSVSGDSSGGMYVISGLMPSTTYSIQVAANTSAGTGPYSIAIDQLTSGMIKYILIDMLLIHFSQLQLQSCQQVLQQPPPSPSPGLVLAQRMLNMWWCGRLII